MTRPASRPLQWRSLEQLADTAEFRRFMASEFPGLREPPTGAERRSFLKLMAASFALAGLSGCGEDWEDPRAMEVPYVNQPLRLEASEPIGYASISVLDGIANGVVVTTVNGRPIKVEGNSEHPWSRGGTDVFMQASVLDLYDPARSQSVRHLTKPANWAAFRGAIVGALASYRAQRGAGLRLLTGPVSSPTLRAQIERLQAAYPKLRWHSYAPVSAGLAWEATRRAFGRPLETRWQFDRAKVIVALEGDFLDVGPQQVGVSRDWITARHASAAAGSLLTLHNATPIPNLTSAKADFPLGATAAEIETLAQGLLEDLSGPGEPPPAAEPSDLARWRARAAAALHAHRGDALVIAGRTASVAVQEAVHRLNAALGNLGQTVFYTQPAAPPAESLDALVRDMNAGEVSTLLLLDVNPVYDAPASLGFAQALTHVRLKVHAGLFQDETALRCDWHLPLVHPLEAWGDGRSWDGTVGVMQPTIAPLFDGRSAPEILSLLVDDEPRSGQDLLRTRWQGVEAQSEFQPRWEEVLRAGFIADTAFAPEAVALQPAEPPEPVLDQAALTAVFRPDPTVWDGGWANNPWLQELPKPLTKLVWDNAVFISPALAQREGLRNRDIIRVQLANGWAEGPVWILPGQADGVIGLTFGYGRFAPDLLSFKRGYNAYALRETEDTWRAAVAGLVRTGQTAPLATTQHQDTMEGHNFVRVQHEGEKPVGETKSWTQPSIYPEPGMGTGGLAAWGMVIDLDACTGCNACVVACQAENNIAVVGREQVARGRAMHWLRVDRYYEGSPDAPDTHFMPVPCMHCENAPCEVGCPVEATLHNHEGLNLQVYNRCIGTRACSSYCPYKVRRFNYYDYSAGVSSVAALQRNPEVTVRSRGVMEKCTYCVQRIELARITADRENTQLPDGAVETACQGACPTRAITFGDLKAKGSAVSKARAEPRNYALLGDLNTRPRTSYLAERAPRQKRDPS